MFIASDEHFQFSNSSTELNVYNVKLTLKVLLFQYYVEYTVHRSRVLV